MNELVVKEDIKSMIYEVRGKQVMFSSDLNDVKKIIE